MNTLDAITIKGKVVGQSRPPFPDWSVPLPPEFYASGQLTLRDLITRIVTEEVEAFRARQQERRVTRVLSGSEIVRGASASKISMGGEDLDQQVDLQAAIAAALQTFEDRFYYVFVDGVQGQSLDQPVRVQPGSAVTFLRLVPLVGG